MARRTGTRQWLTFLLFAACGDATVAEDQDGGCAGGKCDAQDEPAVCDAFLRDHSIGGIDSFRQLGDRLATGALSNGEACPGTLADILGALQANDPSCDRVEVALVSETAQVFGADDPRVNYRAVVPQQCGSDGFDLHKVLFSLFGLTKSGPIPDGFEIVALDERTGAYNYYELGGTAEEPVWGYFGNSFEQIELYTDVLDHDDYARETKRVQGSEARCGACHTGGTLIMKELESPWLHWRGVADMPGDGPLIDRIADELDGTMVVPSDGIMIDSAIKEGASAWNPVRQKTLADAGKARALLRPLFCSVEANVLSRPSLSVPNGALVDNGLLFLGGQDLNGALPAQEIPLSREAYEKAAGDLGTRDTFLELTFMERAFTDRRFVTDLVNDGLIDADLALDVLSIDFTRPVYSDDRCGLLELVPKKMPKIDADAIKEAILAAIDDEKPADGTPAADLRLNLQSDDNPFLVPTVAGFFEACHQRDEEAFAADVLGAFAVINQRARKFAFIEFDRTLPAYDRDALPDSTMRLDPRTCTLVDGYVSAPIGDGVVAIVEEFDGPGMDVHNPPASGFVDEDWRLWFDGDEAWGNGHTLLLGASAQTLSVASGSYGIRREFGDIGGMTATIDFSFSPDGESWFEVLADDGIGTPVITSDYSALAPCEEQGAPPCALTVHHDPAAGEETLSLPAGTRALRIKLGSLGGGTTTAVLGRLEIR